MKSKYIKPETETVEMECGQILAASGEQQTDEVNISGGSYDGVFGAKQHTFSVWGDEEENL